MTVPEDLRDALRELPLFPLRHAVLFPGALLPLHVFEPRYVQMVRTVLESHRCLAIAHVTDPHAEMGGNPPIVETAGVGTIVEHLELPGGRFNVVVLGRARVRLQELCFVPPYRRAIATVRRSHRTDVPATQMAALTAAASAFAQMVRDRDPTFRMRIPKDAPAGLVIDACAHHLVLNATDRQAVLEELDATRRAQLVLEVLTDQRAALSRSEGNALN